MSRPRLRPRPFGQRCPYCHDALAVGADAARCPACGTDTHPACRAEHQACPVCGVGERPLAATVEGPSLAAIISLVVVFLVTFFGPLVPLVDWIESMRLEERPWQDRLTYAPLFLLGVAGCIVFTLAATLAWGALLKLLSRRRKKV